MEEVAFLLLVTVSGILAQTKLGDSCGDITLIDNCPTYKIHPGIANWYTGGETVCCIKNSYPTRSFRKSEEACVKYGPGFERKVSFEHYIQPGEFQHDVAIGYISPGDDRAGLGKCNGILISRDYVLTPAHCIRDERLGKPILIRAGTIDLQGEEDRVKPQVIAISETIVHPDYNGSNYNNDIALLKLAVPANFTAYVQPACLYTEKELPEKMISTGWGTILTLDEGIGDLQFKTNVVEVKACSAEWPTYMITDSKFCGLTDKNVCKLLSGSSAFFTKGDYSRVTIIGLTAAGSSSSCSYTHPVLFIRVSSYLDWIESIVWP